LKPAFNHDDDIRPRSWRINLTGHPKQVLRKPAVWIAASQPPSALIRSRRVVAFKISWSGTCQFSWMLRSSSVVSAQSTANSFPIAPGWRSLLHPSLHLLSEYCTRLFHGNCESHCPFFSLTARQVPIQSRTLPTLAFQLRTGATSFHPLRNNTQITLNVSVLLRKPVS